MQLATTSVPLLLCIAFMGTFRSGQLDYIGCTCVALLVPQEPSVYRLYEAIMHNGEAIKAVINEEFGDGIMSAIDFYCTVDKMEGVQGERRVVITFNGTCCESSVTFACCGRRGHQAKGGLPPEDCKLLFLVLKQAYIGSKVQRSGTVALCVYSVS